jgi:hypothetical protein
MTHKINEKSSFSILTYLHTHIMYLNNSKFFAGVILILLNIGTKYISIQLSKSTEEYLKFVLSKQILIFAMSWMGTRDIYIALGLTAIFTVLSDHIFNEDSEYCMIPQKYRILSSVYNENKEDSPTEQDINAAILTLEKAKKEKERKSQKELFVKYNIYNI